MLILKPFRLEKENFKVDKKKHILFLCSWYPNKTDPTNGNFVQKHTEAAALLNQVSSLSVFSDHIEENIKIDCKSENGIYNVIVYYKKVSSNIPFYSAFLKAKRYFSALYNGYNTIVTKQSKPDLIHVNVVYTIGLFALILKYLKKIPFVVTEHWTAFLPNGYSVSRLTKFISKIIFNQAAMVIPVSEDLKNALIKLGVKTNFEVISNVVDQTKFKIKQINTNEIKQMLHISTAKDDHKNISGILRVLKALSLQRKDFKLLIVSDGNLQEHIDYASKLGIFNELVFFEDTKTTEEISELMQQSDFLLLFSNYENFPCVIAEALVTGLPVVSSNVNGIPEHVNSENGILVKPRDESGLLEALNKMLNNYQNFKPESLRTYGIKHFSYEEIGKKFDAIYQSIS